MGQEGQTAAIYKRLGYCVSNNRTIKPNAPKTVFFGILSKLVSGNVQGEVHTFICTPFNRTEITTESETKHGP